MQIVYKGTAPKVWSLWIWLAQTFRISLRSGGTTTATFHPARLRRPPESPSDLVGLGLKYHIFCSKITTLSTELTHDNCTECFFLLARDKQKKNEEQETRNGERTQTSHNQFLWYCGFGDLALLAWHCGSLVGRAWVFKPLPPTSCPLLLPQASFPQLFAMMS